jgi:pimeloyl-ACP methyl ester carboxylesterase
MSEAAIIKKFEVQIFKPEGTATGITVFLPGTLLKLKEYSSTYDVLVEQNQIVIGFENMNPFPFVGRNHQKMAEDVASVVKEFLAIEEFSSLPAQYNVVGHSLGGKVALMVAAKYDIDNVKKIIALDPVDDKPRELTAPKLSPTTNLGASKAEEIHLFQSGSGGDRWFMPLCPKDRNASVVQELYPDQITSLEINAGAGHMSYKDTEKDDASVQARESVQAKIRAVIS